MPEGYGYSPEGIRRYLEDLAKKHGILPPDVPPADNRDIVNKGLTRPPTGANLGDPLEFTMNPETGERIPTGRTGRVQGPHISEVGPSQRIPSTQRLTLGQQPRTSYISRRKTGPVDSTRGDYFLQPQPPGLQRPPVAGARELGAAGLDKRALLAASGLNPTDILGGAAGAAGGMHPDSLNDLIRKITGSAISQEEANNKMQDFKSKRRTRAWRR